MGIPEIIQSHTKDLLNALPLEYEGIIIECMADLEDKVLLWLLRS